LAYTWQLVQVGHICKIPIILVGPIWESLKEWARDNLIANKLANPEDLDVLIVAKDYKEALEILQKTKNMFEDGCYDNCLNWDKYKAS